MRTSWNSVKRNTKLSKSKKKSFPQVDIDLKLLTETQNKLNKDFDDAFEKIKVREIENTETKLRIESFEIWTIKLDDKIKDVNARVDTSGNPEGSKHLENDMKAFA